MECVACDLCCAAAVQVVTEQGMAEVGEMDADLVGASRRKMQTQEGMLPVCLRDPVVCACGLAVRCNMAQDDARQGACNRCVDRALCRREYTINQCKVLARQSVLPCDLILHFGMFCDEQQPRCIAVKAVAGVIVEPHTARGIETENGVGDGSVRLFGCWMDELTRRLVDDEEIRILVDNGKRQRLGNNRGDNGQFVGNGVSRVQDGVRGNGRCAVHGECSAVLDAFP